MHRLSVKLIALLLLVTLLSACASSPSAEAPTAEPTKAEESAAPAAPADASTGAAVGGKRTFVIVPAESKASYLVDEEFFSGALDKLGIAAGLVDVVGSTQEIEGQLQLNFDNLAEALGENSFNVKLNTLTTDQSRRDRWIRENGPSFNQYPLATFKATAIEGAPSSYSENTDVSFKLVGDLTIRQATKSVTFDITAKVAGDTLTGVATTRLKMSDFGIDPPSFANTLSVADEFGIEVQFTAKEG
jgi:polyisoprenoid-binding protein YceI